MLPDHLGTDVISSYFSELQQVSLGPMTLFLFAVPIFPETTRDP